MKIIEKVGLAVLAIGFLGLIVPGLEAADVKVNCDKGESVQSALDRVTGPTTIVVTGICAENVVIKKDDVTIQGGTFVGTNPSQGTIRVEAARRVLITGATVGGVVGGAWDGVEISQGGSLTVENSLIQGNARDGIWAYFGSSVMVNSCIIEGNGGWGVVASDNAALALASSTITSNRDAGVCILRTSSARIGRFWGGVGRNMIQNNGGPGIRVFHASQALIVGNTIENNTGHGVSVEGASVTLVSNTITANNGYGIAVENAGNAFIGLNDDLTFGAGNTVELNQLEGIAIANGGAAYMANNRIRSNGLTTGKAGVVIARATGRLVGGNIIEGNGGHGVEVDQGALFQGKGGWQVGPGPDTIIQNGRYGISAWNGASLDIQNVMVTNNYQYGIAVGLRSTLRIYGSTVSDHVSYSGIYVYQGSAVSFYHPEGTTAASVTNNIGWGIYCLDTESSYTGDTSGVTGNMAGQVSCTGFGPK